jgi:hypothetical protein
VPAEKRCCWRAHRVGDGENLAAIARRYGVTQGSIVAVNRALDGKLEPGDLLTIPAVVREQAQTISAKRVVHRRVVHRKTAGRKVAAAPGAKAQPAGQKPGAEAYRAANLAAAAGKRGVVQR